jgi:hypothetical protein
MDIANILGIDTVKIDSFDYSESWNIKDYDVVEVYKLSDATINTFVTSSSFILCDKHHESNLWEKCDWSKTPIALPKWCEVYDMAITPLREDSKHNKLMKEIQKTLKDPENYYSLYLKKTKGAVALFVLNPGSKYLYCVYVKI